MKFRTGRHLGRTIYVQTGNSDEPSRELDHVIGMVDTPELGALVCRALNKLAADEREMAAIRAIVRQALEWR